MAQNRVAGLIFIKVNGQQYDAVGNFEYNLGIPMREAMVGASGTDGFKETPQTAFIEGEIRDRRTLDVAALCRMDYATVTIELANEKVIVLNEAWFAGDGNISTEEAIIKVRFESRFQAQEIR
ncbi:tail protein [Nostoc linckia z18]|uniref:Tail protein n=2 Tax=Nostoc linckia TaxID=92942 RepID=A0A9Q6EJP8_NOSLI|nr:phage tail tube protein [Nostoc linckia]PHJ81963.1 tail protein [Nostoc linckia z6]PHJ92861.1 tail protein [Nostoc linckia z7]PHK00816.1 tail protein [Nostoc linckia z8]PHK09306.1 tail protein [Nostoc linckia z9]PHK33090.1 tail protein [Nostoc linckia z18]